MKPVLIGIVAYLLCMGLCIGIFAFVSIKCIQRRDTRNFDGGMRNFIYKIPMPEKQALEMLYMHNVADEMDYTFDAENAVISFVPFSGGQVSYQLHFAEQDGIFTLWLEQISLFQNIIIYRVNPFFVKKLNAEPIPWVYNLPRNCSYNKL